MPAEPLEPGTHSRIAVAAASEGMRAEGAFVAQAWVRPLDGGAVKLARRFGETEDDALDALREAIETHIRTVEKPSAPLGEPVPTPASAADQTIINAREGMRRFAALIYRSHRYVAPDSDAAADQVLSGSDVVPVTVVDGFVSAIVDHLAAWVDKTGGREEEPAMWLSLYSDYTLFRPVLESLAAAVWVLGPTDGRERVKNATRLLATELSQGKKYADRVRRSGQPDEEAEKVNLGLDRILSEVCTKMGFDKKKMSLPVEPSTLPDKASRFIPGSDKRFYRLWAICSAHAHAQLFTVMRHGARSSGSGPHGDWTYVEADSEAFAELVRFTADGLNVLSKLLNERGHSLDAETGPRPGGGPR
ncbi:MULTISPECIES: type II toxin-antitoxin system HicB family antitoxin [unclassified Microbacterium]|uniref:type II toxin-antitoxin system HicB family antitoxin n=1 Tax=unclassified Microbacterium TaxID=2609290 RepID=UPI003870D0A6